MTIETKYNIDDEVLYKGFKDISYDKISNIRIEGDKGRVLVMPILHNEKEKIIEL
jgi:hypothetical protein